jgi:hypothetical protein
LYTITDSVVIPSTDQDAADNVATSTVTVVSTAATALPYSTDFESGVPSGYYFYDFDGSGSTWVNGSGGAGSTYCHSGTFMPWFKLGSFATGASSMIIIPTPAVSGNVALDFWEAYAQNTTSSSDKLEVVYSTDCGTSWNTLWSAIGAAHATTAATTTYWLPDRVANPTSWAKRSISLKTLPSGSILALKATDGGGNNLFIDDINVRAGLDIQEKGLVLNSFSISPNPAVEFANISFNLTETSNVNVSIVDALGKTVLTIANENMTSGTHEMKVNTTSLASGMYLIKVATNNGTVTERLSVIK